MSETREKIAQGGEFGTDLPSVLAARKKEDSIHMQVNAFDDRLTTACKLATEVCVVFWFI